MPEPPPAILDDRRLSHASSVGTGAEPARAAISFSIHSDLHAVEEEWRRFEQIADGTVFQAFDWLSMWQRHIGAPAHVMPAIVVGRGPNGDILFLMPLAVVPGAVRRLTWLGSDLCDYNAPLLALRYSDAVPADRFRALWQEIHRRLQEQPHYRHDLVELTKMPETIGAQTNPFLALDVALHPSGAHMTRLVASWDAFYQAKRSSATRRRDRSKRKRLAQLGEVRVVTPHDAGEIGRTLQTLIEQKSRSFARMGVANLFVRPGYQDFFFDIATNPRTQKLVHVSRLDVGPTWAAINLGLIHRGCYYHVLASYDDGEVARFGPGAVHLRELMAHAIGSGCDMFDFTIGDEPYKSEWADRTLRLYDHVAAATLRGWPLALLARGRRWIKRNIKQNPALWSLFTKVRSVLGSKPTAQPDHEGGEAPLPPERKSPPIAPE